MKKVLALIVAVLLTAAMFAGCQTSNNQPSTQPSTAGSPSATPPAVSPTEAATGFEIAMITDIGNIDDKSFNQGTWEGIKMYAEENNITHKYYKPTEKTTDAYVAAIELAVQGGAKIIITPGYLFEPAIYEAQDLYPEIKFVLIDGDPNDGDWSSGFPTHRIEKNVYSIFFAEQQPGFLAGYAAVKDGYTKLGFLGGMAVPAVIRYGFGFVQGCEYAAKEMGLAAGTVEVKYGYTGNFDETPENQTLAASWYTSGTEVIFACGGKVGNSVMAAAEANNGKVIGVDVDQSFESTTVITSAMKKVGTAAYAALTDYYAGSFKGGVIDTYDITTDMVALPFDTSKFTKFTKAEYEAIVSKLINDTDGLRTSLWNDTTADSADKLPVELVKVNVVS